MIYHSKGKKGEATRHLKRALIITSPFGWSDELFWIHHALTWVYSCAHEFVDANTHLKQAKTYAANNVYNLGRAMCLQASIWCRQYKLGDAGLEALGALEVFEKLGTEREVKICKDLIREVEREKMLRPILDGCAA